MPRLFQFKKDFLLDEHVCGFETYLSYSRKQSKYIIGKAQAYDRIDLVSCFDLWRNRQYKQAINFESSGFTFTFSAKNPFITDEDMEYYEIEKDKAIASIDEKPEKPKTSKEKEEDVPFVFSKRSFDW
jgi:hypothetical protein